MTAVSVTPDGASLRLGRPVALFGLDTTTSSGERAIYVVGNNTGVPYDVLPDGCFVMLRLPDRRTKGEIVLLQNWLDERERLERPSRRVRGAATAPISAPRAELPQDERLARAGG